MHISTVIKGYHGNAVNGYHAHHIQQPHPAEALALAMARVGAATGSAAGVAAATGAAPLGSSFLGRRLLCLAAGGVDHQRGPPNVLSWVGL